MTIKKDMVHAKPSKKRRRGQGLLEFALVLPILLMVIFAIIDFGWVVFNFAQAYNGLRESTRYGSVSGFPPAGQLPQYIDCKAIRVRLAQMSGFSGVKANDPLDVDDLNDMSDTGIAIYYDDGRPYEPSAVPAVMSRVGTCEIKTDGSGNVLYPPTNPIGTDQGFYHDPNYTPEGDATPLTGPPWRQPQNGDRIVIVMHARINMLTPFFRALIPNGIQLNLMAARSIFPQGL